MNGWVKLGVYHQVEFSGRDGGSIVLMCDSRRRPVGSNVALLDYRCLPWPRCQHPACQAEATP